MPAHAVSEVVGHLTPTRLPDAPSALLGIAPLRGDILAVVDAGASTSPINAAKQKAVVLRPGNSLEELPLAFNVDRLGEFLQIGEHEIGMSTVQDPLASFEYSMDGSPIRIIDPARLHGLLSETVS